MVVYVFVRTDLSGVVSIEFYLLWYILIDSIKNQSMKLTERHSTVQHYT